MSILCSCFIAHALIILHVCHIEALLKPALQLALSQLLVIAFVCKHSLQDCALPASSHNALAHPLAINCH